MDTELILEKLLKINFSIKNKFHSKTQFEDRDLEEQFQQTVFETTNSKITASTLVVFLGYFATFFFIIIAFNRPIYIINCLTCFLLSVLSMIISRRYKSPKALFINDHIQIFLSSINMVVKGLILCFSYKNEQNDYVEEMLRIIIYDFVSTNIYLITRLEANIFVSCFYFLINLSLVVLGLIYSSKNRFYYLEGLTSFCVFAIFYAFRKQWDYNLRLIFSEKSKFENYFNYTMNYLEGLNGFNLNVQNNCKISYGLKIHDLMRNLVVERFITDEEINNPATQPHNTMEDRERRLAAFENNSYENTESKELLYNLFFNEFDCFADKRSKNENKIAIVFLKKLTFFKNYEGQKETSKKEKNLNNNNKAQSQDERMQSKTEISLAVLFLILKVFCFRFLFIFHLFFECSLNLLLFFLFFRWSIFFYIFIS